jgi:hypothetical protein
LSISAVIGGAKVIGERVGWKKRGIERGPRPPRWSTVKGTRREAWLVLISRIIDCRAILSCDRPCSLKRMLNRCVLVICGK